MSFARPVMIQPGETVVRTVCPFGCGIACGILAHVRDGRLVRVEPGDFPHTSHVCARGLSVPRLVYHPERLKYPLKRRGPRGEGQWERISWDEAIGIIAEKFTRIGQTYGTQSLAFVSTGVGILANLVTVGFAGACQGIFILPAGLGDSAGPCADMASYGAYQWFGEDYANRFDNPAFCLVWGNNPAVTEPFKWRRIREAKEKGALLVVIDPLFTTTASKADEYIPIRPGTDAALALGMMNVILEKGLHDIAFLTRYTVAPLLVRSDNSLFLRMNDIVLDEAAEYLAWDIRSNAPVAHTAGAEPALTGTYNVNGIPCKPAFQLLSELIRQYPPSRAAEISEVPEDIIRRLATAYATARPAAIYRGMGCTRGSFHGDLSFRAINTLAALTGNVKVESPRNCLYNAAAFLTHGVPGFVTLLQMYETILTGNPHPIKSLWMTRHNLVNQDPNFNKIIRELLPQLELVVVADLFMTTSARYADIILPTCSPFEFDDLAAPIGNGSHDYLQLQQKVIEPLYESRSDLDIYASLAKRMGIDGFLDKTAVEYLEMILASGHPSMEGITLERLREGPSPPEPYDTPPFATPSGRVEFYSERLKPFGQELPVYFEPLESQNRPLAKKYPLTFFSTHPKYRFHSMFANVSWIRELDPEPVLSINPVDAAPRGIHDGNLVRAFNDRGEVQLKARVHQGIRPGLVNLSQGWSPGDYFKGTHQALTHETINPAQAAIYEPNSAFYDTLVEVELVKEAGR